MNILLSSDDFLINVYIYNSLFFFFSFGIIHRYSKFQNFKIRSRLIEELFFELVLIGDGERV